MAGWGQVMEAPECQVSIGNYVWCIHSILRRAWDHCSMFHGYEIFTYSPNTYL